MALLTTGPIVSDVAGKVAGSVFQRSVAGLTLRTLRRPPASSTPAQLTQRSILASLQVRWANLTNQQRTLWDHWAHFSLNFTATPQPTTLTGQQAFIRVNFARIRVGLSILESPGFAPLTFPLQAIEIEIGGPTFLLHSVPAGLFNDNRLLPTLSGPLPPTRNAKPPRLILMAPYTIVDPSTISIGEAYLKAFGRIPLPGQHVWLSYFYMDIQTGMMSPTLEGMFTIE
jgi:hypothetical protein